MTEVSGIGSWAGVDVFAGVDGVAESVASVDEAGAGVRGVPYVPELPARGPGADMIGRSACLMGDLAVDLQPSGWRLVDRPGRDEARAEGFWRQDRDALSEKFEQWTGPMKIAFVGPWTMAAGLRLPRGERVLADEGAVRDVSQALAEGVAECGRRVSGLVPGAQWVVQFDEPSLPAVLAGSLRSSSGYRRHRPVGEDEAASRLREVFEVVRAGAAVERLVVHSCAAGVPVGLLGRAGADAVSVDVSLLDSRGWEACAAFLDGGGELWPGVPVPLSGSLPGARELASVVERPLQVLGLGDEVVDRLVLTPSCGLAGASGAGHAAAVQSRVAEAARVLRENVLG